MAKVSFNSVADETSAQNVNGNNNVEFFSLKDDGNEAIVRFMYDSSEEFDIQTVHELSTANNHYVKVSCIRDPLEPLDKCPLCKANMRISQKFFIRVIQYKTAVVNGVTTVVPVPSVWERSLSYARTLKSYIDNYGPLSDIICKVIRHGRAGDMKTTYEIIPNLNKQIYRDEMYPKNPACFGNFDTLGTIVKNKSYEDLATFVATGAFPEKPNETNEQNAQPVVTPAAPNRAEAYTNTPEVTATPAAPSVTPAPTVPQSSARQMPWNSSVSTAGFDRPRRY